jgi:glycosyltransferase involved in cell wall biosynthesis
MTKLLTIVTVVKNSKENLAAFLRRVKDIKNRDKIELVLIDGLSTDGTIDVIESNSHLISKWTSEPDTGIYDAMNKGIALSSGMYIVLINTDDLIIPDAMTRIIDELSGNSFDIVACAAQMMLNGKKRYLRAPRPLDSAILLRTIPFSHNAAFIRADLYKKIGVYRTDFVIVSDLEFFCRAEKAGAQVKILPITLIESELSGISGRENTLIVEESVQLFRNAYPELSRDFALELFNFRMVYGRSGRHRFDCLAASHFLRESNRLGSDLPRDMKTVVSERPINFVGPGFDILLSRLPRNPEFRRLDAEFIKSRESDANPLITFGITSYNAEATISDTINSLLRQDWPNFEIIIVDDFSEDGTISHIKRFADSRIRLYCNDRNYGVAFSRNRIAMHSRSKYVMFCDDDDISLSQRARACYEKIKSVESQSQCSHVICFTPRKVRPVNADDFYIDAVGRGSPVSGSLIVDYVYAHLLRVSGQAGGDSFYGIDVDRPYAMGTGVGMYPTRLIRALGFNETFRRAEDLEFNLRCADFKERVFFTAIEEPLYIQKITESPEKSKDISFAFYCLLVLTSGSYFFSPRYSPYKVLKGLIRKISSEELRRAMYDMVESSRGFPWPKSRFDS